MSGSGANSDFLPHSRDPNPMFDPGCPRSIGGFQSASILCVAMGIEFQLEKLDCQPFYHGFGESCSDAQLTFAIWKLPLIDIYGTSLEIPFYITQGSGLLLLENNVTSKPDILEKENLIVVPECARLSEKRIVLSTYTTKALRTHLFVVPSHIHPSFHSFQPRISLPVHLFYQCPTTT